MPKNLAFRNQTKKARPARGALLRRGVAPIREPSSARVPPSPSLPPSLRSQTSAALFVPLDWGGGRSLISFSLATCGPLRSLGAASSTGDGSASLPSGSGFVVVLQSSPSLRSPRFLSLARVVRARLVAVSGYIRHISSWTTAKYPESSRTEEHPDGGRQLRRLYNNFARSSA